MAMAARISAACHPCFFVLGFAVITSVQLYITFVIIDITYVTAVKRLLPSFGYGK